MSVKDGKGSSERDPMVKSRSISRPPVKKSKKTSARTAGARIREKSRSAKSATRSAPLQTVAKGKWVYTFGGGKAQGRADVRNLLGGKGRRPRRDGAPRPAGASRLHHQHRGVHVFLPERQNLSEGFAAAGRSCARGGRPHHREKIRRWQKTAARIGALGSARFDAGHAGHGAQSRPQRLDGRGARGKIRRPAIRL